LEGKLCRIYADRPQQCRAFECGLLKRVRGGQLTSVAAMRLIGRVQRAAEQIRDRLRALGNHDDDLPLSRRYQKLMAEPIDLTADEAEIEGRGSLMLEVDELMKLLHQHFLW
jgi:hypothetical protein